MVVSTYQNPQQLKLQQKSKDIFLAFLQYQTNNYKRIQQSMKQITNKQHLVHMLPNSHLVTSLPFIDQEIDSSVPKSKVLYLIASQQQKMNKNIDQYLQPLKMPQLTYVNSDQFQREVARIQKKMEQKQKGKGEDSNKKKQVVFPQVAKKIAVKDIPKASQDADKGILNYQLLNTKNINLELSKKYGPLVLKELIEVLQKQKENIERAIQVQKEEIQSLNKSRKYQQTQTYQRQYDIGQRIKIMLNKRIKMEDNN